MVVLEVAGGLWSARSYQSGSKAREGRVEAGRDSLPLSESTRSGLQPQANRLKPHTAAYGRCSSRRRWGTIV